MMRVLLSLLGAAALPRLALGDLMDFESTELEASHVKSFPAVSFADEEDSAACVDDCPECKAFPSSDDWPSDDEWKSLNETLDGALLYPTPPAAVCYPESEAYDPEQCLYMIDIAPVTHFYVDDPITVLSPWFQGSTCLPDENATGACKRGGYSEYVVNATTVKHVQAAVNFARNKNVRLVIKNTGHSFGGRNVGAGSLSIWTHQLKEFKFLPEYTQGEYTGKAVQFGSGLEAWELYNYMAENNVSVPAPGGKTVGANGGWFTNGGHGNLASLYGLGADQALELHVVTADGRFVIATPEENKDLFWALRGAGSSTYGVITSVVMKAHPPVEMVQVEMRFSHNYGDSTDESIAVESLDTFWEGINTYFRFETTIVDAGGADWNYLYPYGNNSYEFMTRMTLPGKTIEEASEILSPLYESLQGLGIDVVLPDVALLSPIPYAEVTTAPAEPLANTRYRSRLFPRKNWEDPELFNKTMSAIRKSIEGTLYTFHGLSYGATKEVAGWPGSDSAVNPAWREAIQHSILLHTQPNNYTAEEARAEEEMVQEYMDTWRAVSPGAGSYMNEGDPGEPDWQQAFYGDLYPKLVDIKKKRDPWSVFWAPTTVGSEGWEVRTEDGYPRSQNGRLCRTG